MSKVKTVKMLDTIIGKLIHVSGKIGGNHLQEAMREVSYVRDRIQSGDIKIKSK